MPEYGDIGYWNERYSKEGQETFDWYVNWNDIKSCSDLRVAFENLVDDDNKVKMSPKPRVLIVGIGNSLQAEDMAEDGWDVFAIDYSPVVIEKMKKIGTHGVDYVEMDARKMNFDENTFDLVIDKGTLDAILCGKDSTQNAMMVMKSIYTVLKPNSHFICVTYGRPDARIVHLQQPFTDWDVSHCLVDKIIAEDEDEDEYPSTQYHGYVACKPGPKKKSGSADNDGGVANSESKSEYASNSRVSGAGSNKEQNLTETDWPTPSV